MTWIVGIWGRPGSNSEKIALHIGNRIGAPVVNFVASPDAPMASHLVMVAANHGDAEVPEDIEKFLQRRGSEIDRWVVLEIGNYYGFDDWSYGARERIALYLDSIRKGGEVVPGAGIDTLPHIDWVTLDRWCDTIRSVVPAKDVAHAE
jgi:hypothetical protein